MIKIRVPGAAPAEMEKRMNQENQAGREIPLGLGMALVKDIGAWSYFTSLDPQKREQVIGYVKASTTGPEAKERVRQTVESMKNQNMDLFSV